MQHTTESLKYQGAVLKNLEAQLGQLSRQNVERCPSNLPSDTVVNPKEHCQVVTLKSGKSYEGPGMKD